MKKKLPKITTLDMEVSIAKHFGIRQHIIVPNLSWGFFSHECDLFFVRKSNFASLGTMRIWKLKEKLNNLKKKL